jgi:hypothetical protein
MRWVRVDGEDQLANVAALFIIGTGSTNTKLTDMIMSINKVLLIFRIVKLILKKY